MSQREDLVHLVEFDEVSAFISQTKNIRDIDAANIKIKIHKDANNNNNNNNRESQNLIPDDGLTLLHVAAFYDALDCFRYLYLSRQIPLRKQSSHSFLPLHYACWSGASEVALYILTCDPSQATYAVQGAGYIQLLYCSFIGGDIEIIQSLTEKGASLSQPHNDQNILVTKAIGLHRSDILKLIFKDYKPQRGSTDMPPVAKAAIDFNPEALEMLYNGKEDILCKIPEKPNENLISLICDSDRQKKFKDILINKILKDAKEMNLEPTNPSAPGICHWACSYMDVDVAREMFKLPNFNINRTANDKTGPMKLVNRVEKEALDMLSLLIDRGFEINNTHGGKVPSLLECYVAAIRKDIPAITLLLNNGADVDIKYTKSRSNQTIYEFVMSTNNEQLKKLFAAHKKQ